MVSPVAIQEPTPEKSNYSVKSKLVRLANFVSEVTRASFIPGVVILGCALSRPRDFDKHKHGCAKFDRNKFTKDTQQGVVVGSVLALVISALLYRGKKDSVSYLVPKFKWWVSFKPHISRTPAEINEDIATVTDKVMHSFPKDLRKHLEWVYSPEGKKQIEEFKQKVKKQANLEMVVAVLVSAAAVFNSKALANAVCWAVSPKDM